MRVAARSLLVFFFFFFWQRRGLSLQTNDTTPHGPASPPYSYSSLQIGSLRGLVAPRKCTQAWRAGEGERRSGHSPAGPRPGGPQEARGPWRQGRGSCRSGADSGPPSPFFLLRPFHVGHGAAGHVGDASPGGPGLSALGWLWPLRAPSRPAAWTCPLPRLATPTSFWAPVPAVSAF